METQVRTPQLVFMQPQRLIVPLFQRPYVWNQENQWEPLWADVTLVAERLMAKPDGKHQPHFLGAVVLQQTQNPVGLMQTRTIIDGQQRLTTLQLLLDALHAELSGANAAAPAARLATLVLNDEPFRSQYEDRFKVWPTNRDREPFNAVMGAEPPIDYGTVAHAGTKMVKAHRFFSDSARTWLMAAGSEQVQKRATAIERVVRELLQMVVIDLAADENAQEIFETLNSRGAQLTAADLIKNFIFQRLLETGADVEEAYQEHWREFETGFWETEVSVGRFRYPRSALFLNHWLVARTGEEVVAREVFQRFKRFADYDVGVPMALLLSQIHRAAGIYRRFVESATSVGSLDRLGLFGYRTGVLESEVIKPLVLSLLDPEKSPIPRDELEKALDAVESWMVRRMLVRATTKGYNQFVAELVTLLHNSDRALAGDTIQRHLAAQTSDSRYWPDDDELQREVAALSAYRRLGRGRLRMVLEAAEDHLRGYRGAQAGMAEQRVSRGLAIEHVMPRKWQRYWPLTQGVDERERESLIHTLGNLTLLTKKLNSKVSNGPWLDDEGKGEGKRTGLKTHSVLKMSQNLIEQDHRPRDHWAEEDIRQRTATLVNMIRDIWPVPPEHRSPLDPQKRTGVRKKVQLEDLIAGGALEPGMTLFARRPKGGGRAATLLPDGQIDLDGVVYPSPSKAASAITGHPTNGWWFFLVDQSSRRSLRTVRREYVDAMAADLDEDDDGDDDEEDDEAE